MQQPACGASAGAPTNSASGTAELPAIGGE